MTRASAAAQLVFGLLVIAASIAFLLDAARLPPPRFDVLGSAAVPRALCVLVIVIALPFLIQAAFSLWRSDGRPSPANAEVEATPPRRPGLAVLTFVLVCAYVAVLQNGVASYGVATAVLLTLLTALLAKGRPATLAVGVAMAVLIGFGGDYIFSSIFLIALP